MEGNVTPMEGNETPMEGNETPMEGNEAPMEGNETPMEGNETPMEGNETPMEGNEAPMEGNEAPMEKTSTPAAGRNHQAGEASRRASGSRYEMKAAALPGIYLQRFYNLKGRQTLSSEAARSWKESDEKKPEQETDGTRTKQEEHETSYGAAIVVTLAR
jgi:hypothetical protein